MDDFSKTLQALAMGTANRGKVVGTTEVGDYTVDTCYTMDYAWETGIQKSDGDWIIVERYATEEDAGEGHTKWCEFCKANPKEAYSVQFSRVEAF